MFNTLFFVEISDRGVEILHLLFVIVV